MKVLAVGPDDWMDDGACRGLDPDVFFPRPDRYTGYDWTRARAICAGCRVRSECLNFAVTNRIIERDTGMWGGATDEDRRRMRRAQRAVSA